TICPNCREAYEGSRDDLVRYGFPIPEALGADTGGKIQLFRGEGCEKCKGSGYKGRTGLHELMVMTDDLRDEVLKRAPSHQLRNLALREGMMTLQMDAVAKVLKGVTTVEEVLRVVYA
ncbi:MAG: type II secretion system protein GspE, partial [Fimbriimonadaceae bacterium]